MKVAIIGGGITGLVAAYELAKQDYEIDLYEASGQLGGKITTCFQDGLLIEQGPDCFFTRKPGVMELVCELGLQDQLINPLQSEFGMLVKGELHPIPRGLVNLANPDPEAIRKATFLGNDAKREAASPPPSPSRHQDVSIREFFSAKYGPEFSRLVAEPLLAGTHGGDPARLSMQALYPAYLSPSAPSKGNPGPTFLSFKGGMATFIGALQSAIESRTAIHLNARIESLNDVEADHILLAIPAPSAANLLPEPLATTLRKITHRSTVIVTFAFPKQSVGTQLNYTGFLVPEGEHPFLTGSTWSSEKWEGRAPLDTFLVRVFVKEGTSAEEALDALRPLLNIQGEPIYQNITRWSNAQPQYELGHLSLIEEIEKLTADLGNVTLTGTSYEGVGIPDCIRQGQSAAKKIQNVLLTPGRTTI